MKKIHSFWSPFYLRYQSHVYKAVA